MTAAPFVDDPWLVCDVCLSESRRSLAFSLRRQTLASRTVGGRQMFGSIRLCQPCWSRIAKPRDRSKAARPVPVRGQSPGLRASTDDGDYGVTAA